MLNLRKLFIDVFDPQAGEKAVVLVDLPHAQLADTDEWRARRKMAERWHAALSALGKARHFDVLPLVHFDATGTNNGELPETGRQAERLIDLEEIFAHATLLLALTQYSASAPLIGWTRRYPLLRVASMPGVAPQMESSALAADYTKVARSCQRLHAQLKKACAAEIEFSSGDHLHFDFRFREPETDDGRLHRDAPLPRLINLPSGETFTAAYEGEKGPPSLTRGVLPVWWRDELVSLHVKANRVEEVVGETSGARTLREFIFLDPARGNVAELGLGCNPMARVWGNVLEDEKAGPHIALGRSEHLGGSVGPEAFREPGNVWHQDFVYARGCPIQIRQMSLLNLKGDRAPLFADGSYVPDLEIGI